MPRKPNGAAMQKYVERSETQTKEEYQCTRLRSVAVAHSAT